MAVLKRAEQNPQGTAQRYANLCNAISPNLADDLRPLIEAGKLVAKIDMARAVSLEIFVSQARRRDAMDHRAVAQNRKIEAGAIERNQRRMQFGETFSKGRDQFGFGALSDMGRAK